MNIRLSILTLVVLLISCEPNINNPSPEKRSPAKIKGSIFYTYGIVIGDTAVSYWIGDGTNYGNETLRNVTTRIWIYNVSDSLREHPIGGGVGKIGRLDPTQMFVDSTYSTVEPGQYFGHETKVKFYFVPGSQVWYQFAFEVNQ